MLNNRAKIKFIFGMSDLDSLEFVLGQANVAAVFCKLENECGSRLFEARESLKKAVEQERLHFFTYRGEKFLAYLLKHRNLLSAFDNEILDLSNGKENLDEFQSLLNDAQSIARKTVADMKKSSKKTIENSLNLLSSCLENPGIVEFKDRFADVAAFIVCAGPSLDKNIDQLSKIGDTALILAVDTVVPALMKCGIKPHFVFSADFRNKSKFFEGCHWDVPLVFHAESSWKSVQAYSGPKLVWASSNPLPAWINSLGPDKGTKELGMSVAGMALNAAHYFGVKKIVLLGQDFAYSKESRYSGLSEAQDKSVEQQEKVLELESRYDGSILETKEEYYMYLRYTEQRIADLALDVVNATEGGAGIRGTQDLRLSDAIEKFCDIDCDLRGRINARMIKTDFSFEDLYASLSSLHQEAEIVKNLALELKEDLQKAFELAEKTVLDKDSLVSVLNNVPRVMNDIFKEKKTLSFLHGFLTESLLQIKYQQFMNVSGELAKLREDYCAEYSFALALADAVGFWQSLLAKRIKEIE